MASDVVPQTPAAEQKPAALVAHRAGPLAFLTDTAAFNHLWRIASGYSRSMLVPAAFRGKVEDCFIICQLALRMNVDPFMLMQNTYVVHGRPGFEAKLAIALLNASGKIKGTLKCSFDGKGDEYGCRAWAVDDETGEKITGPKVDWAMVKGEKWNQDKQLRDGGGVQKSKWNTMPDLMFQYRAAAFFIRTNYPEVLMGMRTVDEIEEQIIDVVSQPAGGAADLLLQFAGDNAKAADNGAAASPESADAADSTTSGSEDTTSTPDEPPQQFPPDESQAPPPRMDWYSEQITLLAEDINGLNRLIKASADDAELTTDEKARVFGWITAAKGKRGKK
jgi:hypothetical protein